jgi:hypothetical protein
MVTTGRCAVLTFDDARAIALGLPEVVEQDHHGMPSFRVRGKILATVPDDGTVRVMLGEEAILAAVAENVGVCSPVLWGRRLSAVAVDLAAAGPELLRELVVDAWLQKAPASLRSTYGDLI